jgi:hypothetical protein
MARVYPGRVLSSVPKVTALSHPPDTRPLRAAVSLFLLLFLVACTPGASAVHKRAAADLDCPAKDVRVVPLSLSKASLLANPDDALYEAKGCGKRLEYWVKDRVIRPHHGEWYAPR